MSNKIVESKNVKRYYVPKTAVIYFSDCELSVFDDFTKSIVEYTEFMQIGSVDKSNIGKKSNAYRKRFFPWLEFKKNEERVMKAATFFNTIGSEIAKTLKGVDIAVIVYKSNDLDTLDYVSELSSILCKNDVFAFHFVLEKASGFLFGSRNGEINRSIKLLMYKFV